MMHAADVVALGAFVGTVTLGMATRTVRAILRKRPAAVMRERMASIKHARIASGSSTPRDHVTDLFHRREQVGAAQAWLQSRISRITVVGGKRGVKVLFIAPLLACAITPLAMGLLPVPDWCGPVADIMMPALVAVATYRMLIARFCARFLNAFPDALDLIIRAVRAGVPVGQAIRAAGDESVEPVGAQFRMMGDALRLGIDMQEVLSDAVRRIEIADFSFFAVCLLLQRETGGQLSETLENLAAILRTRRDIRLKTKALTAEGRMASRIIAAVPPFILLAMYLTNRSYIEVLFTTPTGNKILTAAGVLLVFGLVVIQKMSKLDTSR